MLCCGDATTSCSTRPWWRSLPVRSSSPRRPTATNWRRARTPLGPQSPTCDFWRTGWPASSAAPLRIHPGLLVVEHRAPGRVRVRRLLRLERLPHRRRQRSRRGRMVRPELLRHRPGLLDRHPEPHPLRLCGRLGHAARRHRNATRRCAMPSALRPGPWFQAVQDSQHRDIDVLMLYPLSLVACEERFGSWMVQYGYANYVTPRKLLEHGRVGADGPDRDGGRKFGTVVVLFEPLPPPGTAGVSGAARCSGGKVIWSGPPPRFDLAGKPVLERWQKLFGVKALGFGLEGQAAAAGRSGSAARSARCRRSQSSLTSWWTAFTRWSRQAGLRSSRGSGRADRWHLHRAGGKGKRDIPGLPPP